VRIGVIGAGRVGAVIAAALRGAGHDVVAASGVSAAAKHRIKTLLPGTLNLPADQVARSADDLLIVAVPDDALAGVMTGLAATGSIRPGQIVAHTSGAHGLEVLRPAVEQGARPLALHPAMTFAGTPADVSRLRGISFGVTAPASLRDFAASLVAELGGTPEWISDDQRVLYHASLAHGANHLVTLVNDATDRLREAGVREPAKVLGPLLSTALENALKLGDDALTGPVSRGDAGTVAGHAEVLANTGTLPSYLALARRTADRAIASGRLRGRDAEPLLEVLATQPPRASEHLRPSQRPESSQSPRVGQSRSAGEGRPGRSPRSPEGREMKTVSDPAQARGLGDRTGVVMTMGALHEGHATLLRTARAECDFLVATIFVNPLQFGPSEDLAKYPRTLEEDLEICRAEGVDLVFTPSPETMYPHGQPVVTVDPGPLANELEGAVRPGHFAGVLTVVLKLLNLTGAAAAYFGEKDYQQLTLIRQMAADLDLPAAIIGVPTVREADGLALSSRNRFLSVDERALALGLSRALRAGAAQHTPDAVLATAGKELAGLSVDYLELRDPALGPPPVSGPARLLVAARLGTTRLIDNTLVELEQ
jgi:pantoate--beta-alanine ligase